MNNKLSPSKRAELAELAGISPQYLYQCLSGRRCMGSLLAARVEHVTNGAVTRKELRPNDWHLVWPELKDEAVHHLCARNPGIHAGEEVKTNRSADK